MSVCSPVIRNMRINYVLFGGKIYGSTVNCTKMEGSYEYTDTFCLTSVKTEELLSIVGPFLHQETNQSHALSEKQFLNTALHWLGTGEQRHSVCDMHGVPQARVHILISSLTDDGEGVSASNTEVHNSACC